jgi:anti-sigma factor RsiW
MHLMVTPAGQPVAGFLTPGGLGEVDAWQDSAEALPDGAMIDAAKASHDSAIADVLQEVEHMALLPRRKKNAKRAFPPAVSLVQHDYRKIVETAGSLIAPWLPQSMHAVTSQGFALKVALFVIASSLNGDLNL